MTPARNQGRPRPPGADSPARGCPRPPNGRGRRSPQPVPQPRRRGRSCRARRGDPDGREAQCVDIDALRLAGAVLGRLAAVLDRPIVAVAQEEASQLRVAKPGAPLGGQRGAAVRDVGLTFVAAADVEDAGGRLRPEEIEVITPRVVGDAAAVVGPLAVGPPHRADQALGGAIDLQVFPVRLRVHRLGSELDVRAPGADREAFDRAEIQPGLAQSLAIRVVGVPALAERPVESAGAARVGAQVVDPGVLELREQAEEALVGELRGHARPERVEVVRLALVGIPPLDAIARIEHQIEALTSLLPGEGRLPVETIVVRRVWRCLRGPRDRGEQQGHDPDEDDGRALLPRSRPCLPTAGGEDRIPAHDFLPPPLHLRPSDGAACRGLGPLGATHSLSCYLSWAPLPDRILEEGVCQYLDMDQPAGPAAPQPGPVRE